MVPIPTAERPDDDDWRSLTTAFQDAAAGHDFPSCLAIHDGRPSRREVDAGFGAEDEITSRRRRGYLEPARSSRNDSTEPPHCLSVGWHLLRRSGSSAAVMMYVVLVVE